MRITIVALILPFFLCAQQKLTLEDIWLKYAFYPKSATSFNVMRDGKNYADVEGLNDGVSALTKYDLKTGKKVSELVNGNDVRFEGRPIELNTYEFSPKEDK